MEETLEQLNHFKLPLKTLGATALSGRLSEPLFVKSWIRPREQQSVGKKRTNLFYSYKHVFLNVILYTCLIFDNRRLVYGKSIVQDVLF